MGRSASWAVSSMFIGVLHSVHGEKQSSALLLEAHATPSLIRPFYESLVGIPGLALNLKWAEDAGLLEQRAPNQQEF